MIEIALEHVHIAAPNFASKGILAYPEAAIACGRILVSCPHPMLGGTLDNPVVLAILRGTARAGFAALAWNYRARAEALGQTELDELRARFWDDHRLAESSAFDVDDARDVYEWFRGLALGCSEEISGLAGYSYGGIVGLLLANDRLPVFAVSPPLRALSGPAPLSAASRIVLAEEDFAVTDDELFHATGQTRTSDRIVTIAGSDHLFVEHADAIAEAAFEWASALTQSSSSAPSDCQASSLL